MMNAFYATDAKSMINETRKNKIELCKTNIKFLQETDGHHEESFYELRNSYLIKNNYNGVRIQYYFNGEVSEICECVDGKINGLYKSYYSNGFLETRSNFVNGREHGIFESFYTNGQLRIKCNCVYGVLNGMFKMYDPFGNIVFKCEYKDGQKIESKKKFIKQNKKSLKKYCGEKTIKNKLI